MKNTMSERKRLVKCSVLVCGLPCGKTALIQRYKSGEFTEEYTPTTKISHSIITREYENECIELSIFDTCTNNILSGTSGNPMVGKDGFIVVFDITDYESFAYTKSFFDAIRCHADTFTLPVLVGNKVDLETDRTVSGLVAEDFAKELNIPYMETSAKDGTCVNELFETVLMDIIRPSEGAVARKWNPLKLPHGCTKCTCAIT